jgi:hypothetical protein
VFLVVWGFTIMVFPLQPGCAIVMSPFNNASLMCVVCLGVSVLATCLATCGLSSWSSAMYSCSLSAESSQPRSSRALLR